VDANRNTITVDPHLPADWDHAALRHIPVGANNVDLEFLREGRALVIRSGNSGVKVISPHGIAGKSGELRILLPAVEVSIPHDLPLPGSATQQLKVLSQTEDAHSLTLEFEAQGGSIYDLLLRLNGAHNTIHAEGATVLPSTDASNLGKLHIAFPQAGGYQQQRVRLTW
jgi:hypothetical protein